ncbi:MAG: trypsin-like peptidase domain-containing protein [Patescibacteria group bacterium]
MRRLMYLLLIIAAVFFVVRYQSTAPPTVNVPDIGLTEPSALKENQAASSTATTLKQPEPKITKKEPSPVVKSTPPPVDSETLKQIQAGLNQAAQGVENLKTTTTPIAPKIRLAQSELYNKAQNRIVNFFCQQGNQFRVASGIIISPTGYILTNAHVAEGYDTNFECLIRQGSPARNFGYARLIMLPQAYKQAASRKEQAENDVSIWKMTRGPGDPNNPAPLPETFPYYSIDQNYYPERNQPLVTFSYPSELLGYEIILKSLNMLFAETIVSDFDQKLILSTTGLSSQIGSSGGILVDVYTNQMAGLIFAVSKEEQISQRNLISLTNNSIDRITQAETGLSLAEFLSQ